MSAQRRSPAAARLLACGASLIAAFALTGAVGASPALAQSAWWHLMSGSRPTNLKEGPGQIVVTAANLGDADANGTGDPVKIVDTLPAGLTAMSIEAVASGQVGVSLGMVECSLESLTCTFEHELPSFAQIEVRIGVAVGASAASGELNEARVSGGEAPSVSISGAITVSEQSTPAGVQSYELTTEESGGSLDSQAGSHPDQTTLSLMLNQTAQALPVALPKDLRFNLPAGLIGDFRQGERCSPARFYADPEPECSGSVGRAIVTLNEPGPGLETISVPVYNLEPDPGEPARLGFMLPSRAPVLIDSEIHTSGDYGMTLSADNITEVDALLGIELTIGGSGSSPWELPTSCTGPLQSSAEADSWAEPGVFALFAEPMPGLEHCDRLPFDPSIRVALDAWEASTPSGVSLDLHVPQEVSLDPAGLGEADVKDATVTLPPGVTLNPEGANGLQTCSREQAALESSGPSSCPNAAKLATVRVRTPLSVNPLEGAAYAAAPTANPFGSPMALYIFAEDPVSGLLIKLAGEVTQNPVTGQLSATFDDVPQLPFEDLELHLFGGPRAPLETPNLCGAYTTTASFAPWSGLTAAESTSTFDITAGQNGTSCQSQDEAVLERRREERSAAASKPEEQKPASSGGVQGATAVQVHLSLPVPDARLTRMALKASSAGTVSVEVSCPVGESSCSGTVTLRTLNAVAASLAGAAKSKASILTLATGSFKVAGGKVTTVKLHLSAKARALLARLHVLRARATIVAHDPAGASHTTQIVVTLRVAKARRGKA